eukprot:CAMPEP_0194762918 /NCGR_PEP_ID=MMETSP0323_2-20130528/17142_1 /TAXON_ID=2866 ORGANISM="Crypthecodinium cohnii, Strain Seligo" /NCGR_SAMPLE_ID=MMETSP0323_2 /ASSEMBLY_ACC=CAM_ASM_000346 /LENGTH=46 /DNA_ID= /DNA_START= /DNA_END= /DNA_ORIENTATION=
MLRGGIEGVSGTRNPGILTRAGTVLVKTGETQHQENHERSGGTGCN